MTDLEALKTLDIAIAEVEWEYPMEYAVAFEAAQSALRERIERNNGWISVEDRLPEKDGRYLAIESVWGHPNAIVLSFCIDGEKIDNFELRGIKNAFYDYSGEYGFVTCGGVTHWMPFPTPPKEDKI